MLPGTIDFKFGKGVKFRLKAYFNTSCFKINKYYLKNKKVVNFSKVYHFNNFKIFLFILSVFLAYLFLNCDIAF